MTCVDIDAAVAGFGPIFYGNPFRGRKVSRHNLSNLITVPQGDLKSVDVLIAASRHEPLLFGHEMSAFCIGKDDVKLPGH
jgi:hypothetical protein